MQPQRRFTTNHVVGGLVIGMALGFLVGQQARGRSALPPAPTEVAQSAEALGVGPLATQAQAPAGADKFGRAPGDEHFGHDHPNQPAAAPANAAAPAAPTDGGPDSFGRVAGSEHYGHNHP